MSKEPVKREVEPVSPLEGEGWKHGYTPQQIKIIEDARGEPSLPTPKAEDKTKKSRDEDEEEERRDQKRK